MIIDLEYEDGDNKKYLAGISSLIATLVKENEPKNLYVTRINKWFDHKWLKYSGKGRVKFEGSPFIDTSLDAFWRDKLTFPPFNPKQIGEQFYWSRNSDGTYSAGEKEPRWIYKRELRSSADNLNKRVTDFTESGLFVWFTSFTEKNMHGSLMVYLVKNDDVMAWYASMKNDNHWTIDKTKGINKKLVEEWFPF